MSVKTVEYKGNLSANTDRGPSRSIWADCPVAEFQQHPDKGMYFFDDFLVMGSQDMTAAAKGSIGQWASYGSAGAILVDGAAEGGVLGMNSDGDQEAVTLQSSTGAFRITTTSTLALNGKLWFEARVGFSTITTTRMDCFIGLCDKLTTSNLTVNTIPISTTDDTLSTVPNLIGFHKKSGASTEINFVYQLAGGTAVYPTGLTTLMNSITGAVLVTGAPSQAAMVKLGFLFDPNAYSRPISSASTGQTAGVIARPLITVFVNGLPAASFLTSTNVQGAAFPTGFMGPTLSVMQTSANSSSMYTDWVRVAQNGTL